MAATRGTQMLKAAGISFGLHPYDYDPGVERIGVAAAEALGIAPSQMLKTLIIEVDGKPCCCVIPADAVLSMKKAAAAFGGKQAQMMPPPKAEKITGYHVGGISPFGTTKSLPVALEAQACSAERVWINAGQRGLLLSITPADALRALRGFDAQLCA